MLSAYFDESGTHIASTIMTFAGYVSSDDRWKLFSREWAIILNRFHVHEFKTADWYNRKGEFAGWSDGDRYRLWHSLARVIDDRVRFAVSVSVPVAAHARLTQPKVSKTSVFRDPYAFGMQACVECIVSTPLRRGDRVTFIFDEGHRRQGLMAQRFTELVKSRNWNEVDPVCFRKSSADCEPLQAADMIAWTTRKHLDDEKRDPKAKARPELIRLRRNVRIFGGVLNMESLMADVDKRVASAIQHGSTHALWNGK